MALKKNPFRPEHIEHDAAHKEAYRVEPINPKPEIHVDKHKKKHEHKDASTRAHEYEIPRSISGSQQQQQSKQTHNTMRDTTHINKEK